MIENRNTEAELDDDDVAEETNDDTVEEDVEEKTVKRGRGRPKGSKNKPKFQIGNTAPAITPVSN